MAVMQSRDTRTFIAGEDLSSSQFKFVTLEADGQVDLADSAGERALGVLLNKPTSGKAATVAMTGKVMIEAGASVTAGDQLQTDANGDAITAASGDVVMGYALEDAVDGQIFAMELIQGGNVVA
jgi:autotransporter translocation and assembly factor TamB